MQYKLLTLCVLGSLLLPSVIFNNTYGQSVGISYDIKTVDGSKIIISGYTNLLSNDITFIITSPIGNIVEIDQITPDMNGLYETEFTISDLWQENGVYTIKLKQANYEIYTVSAQINVFNGVFDDVIINKPAPQHYFPTIADDTFYNDLKFDVDISDPTRIKINGITENAYLDATLVVKAPNSNIITIDQITPNQNGSFNTSINIGCESWNQNGLYNITIQQGVNGHYKKSINVDIQNCVVVPEFELALPVFIIGIIMLFTLIYYFNHSTVRNQITKNIDKPFGNSKITNTYI